MGKVLKLRNKGHEWIGIGCCCCGTLPCLSIAAAAAGVILTSIRCHIWTSATASAWHVL